MSIFNLNSIILICVVLLNSNCVNSSHMELECGDSNDNQDDSQMMTQSFKCYNGGVCIRMQLNETSSIKICRCRPGFSGRQCTEKTFPCTSDMCGSNGYCDSFTDNNDESSSSSGSSSNENKYFCRCYPGYTGDRCQENINDCLSGICYNGGSCIDGINSYECDCKWPFIGRYCATRLTCQTDDVCKNNGKCVEEIDESGLTNGIRCLCPSGYEGNDCSIKVDKCKSQPCLYGGICHSNTTSDYKCVCKPGRIGKNCEHENVCLIKRPCKNNSTCINLINNDNEPTHYCKCPPQYIGINCEFSLNGCDQDDGLKCNFELTYSSHTNEINTKKNRIFNQLNQLATLQSAMTTPTPTPTTTTRSTLRTTTTKYTTFISTRISTKSNENILTNKKLNLSNDEIIVPKETKVKNESETNNGSFVLFVNIEPNEFKSRKNEIIKDLETRFGIIMLIKKESSSESSNEMIYPFYPMNSNSSSSNNKATTTPWTKIYFIIVFACQFDSNLNSFIRFESIGSSISSTRPFLSSTSSSSSSSSTSSKNRDPASLCLQNNVENVNDVNGILKEIKKASNLLPNYVSNISFEAYSNSRQPNRPSLSDTTNELSSSHNNNNNANILQIFLICFSISSFIVILIVVVKTNTKIRKIKAPIWYPPIGDNNINVANLNTNKNSFNENTNNKNNEQQIYEMIIATDKKLASTNNNYHQNNKTNSNDNGSGWSFSKKIDQFAQMFFPSSSDSSTKQQITVNNKLQIKADDSPPSSDNGNDYSDLVGDCKPPVKIRKLDLMPIYSTVNSSSSSSSSGSSSCSSTNQLLNSSSTNKTNSININMPPPNGSIQSVRTNTNQQPATPEYYPSPPESLPDASFHQMSHNNLLSNNPINFKGGFYGMTPLMVFIMGRSKLRNSSSNKQMLNKDVNERDVIDSFIANGVDLNAQNLDGETALHLAVRCGLYDISDQLIKNGADLFPYDNYGRNVLHTAVGSNEYEIVKLILDHCSANISNSNNPSSTTTNSMTNNNYNHQIFLDDKMDIIDSKTNDDLGDTSLIMASRLNLNNLIKLLVEYNASVNATDNEGRSALHWCAKVNNVNGALLLIQSGANVNMPDNDEKTPLNSALGELCTKQVADLLIKCDAFVSSDDEIKYNKMKQIIESLNNTTNNKYNNNGLLKQIDESIKLDLIVKDLVKIKQEPTMNNNICISGNGSLSGGISHSNNLKKMNNNCQINNQVQVKKESICGASQMNSQQVIKTISNNLKSTSKTTNNNKQVNETQNNNKNFINQIASSTKRKLCETLNESISSSNNAKLDSKVTKTSKKSTATMNKNVIESPQPNQENQSSKSYTPLTPSPPPPPSQPQPSSHSHLNVQLQSQPSHPYQISAISSSTSINKNPIINPFVNSYQLSSGQIYQQSTLNKYQEINDETKSNPHQHHPTADYSTNPNLLNYYSNLNNNIYYNNNNQTHSNNLEQQQQLNPQNNLEHQNFNQNYLNSHLNPSFSKKSLNTNGLYLNSGNVNLAYSSTETDLTSKNPSTISNYYNSTYPSNSLASVQHHQANQQQTVIYNSNLYFNTNLNEGYSAYF